MHPHVLRLDILRSGSFSLGKTRMMPRVCFFCVSNLRVLSQLLFIVVNKISQIIVKSARYLYTPTLSGFRPEHRRRGHVPGSRRRAARGSGPAHGRYAQHWRHAQER